MQPSLFESALLDQGTNILLAASTFSIAVEFVNRCSDNTFCLHYLTIPRPRWSFHKENPDRYIAWTWGNAARQFSKTRPDRMTEIMRARSQLASEKIVTVSNIMGYISQARYKIGTGIFLQETVDVSKKMQAMEFKNSGCDENRILEFPYVLQYADFARITLKQAADQILLKAKFDDQILAKTELLRLKYFDKVGLADDSGQLSRIFEEFLLDYYKNAMV